MRAITITLVKAGRHHATTGDKKSTGGTAGEALDALAAQLQDEEQENFIIVQNFQADRFFNHTRRKRLTDLMRRHGRKQLNAAEETELEALVEAELDAARRRAETLSQNLK